MGAPMISPKVIVECPDLSAKKHSKKENPIRRGGSTQCMGWVFSKWEVGDSLPTMCDIFNFTRMKNLASLFLLTLLSDICTL